MTNSFSRTVIAAFAVLLLGGMVAAQAQELDPNPPKELRFAYLRSLDGIALARIKGTLAAALAKQGTTLSWAGPFAAFAPAAEAINAGSAQMTTGSSTSAASALAGASPIVIFGFNIAVADAEGILVKRDGPIKTINDLVGKSVAVNRGGSGEYLLMKALERYHIPADKVKRVYLGPSDASTAFAGGNVDAWAVWDPYVAIAEVKSDARLLLNAEQIGSENANVLVSSADFLKAHRATVKIVYDVARAEGEWGKAHPDEATALWAKDAGISPDVAHQVALHSLPVFGPGDAAATEHVASVAKWFYDNGVIPTLPDVKPLVADVTK